MSLRADGITVHLGRRPVLRDVTLALEPGEVLAVVGPNGAGKSTFLRSLAGELAPRAGRVSLDGIPLRDLPPAALALRRAVLAQRPALSAAFPVSDVVRLGRHPHRTPSSVDRLAIRRALSRVGLLEAADVPWTRLSGGEQQRVMLARVLAQLDTEGADDHGRYLLLDEPTSALDLSWSHRVLDLARARAADGLGILVILHDLALAATKADRVALLVDGRLDRVGPPAEVLSPDALARAFHVEARWVDVPPLGALPVVVGTRGEPVHARTSSSRAHEAPDPHAADAAP
jgi:iron complex transport system ATP-binding protein